MIDRSILISSLPITCGGYMLRLWNRADLDRRAQWPSYPPPYEVFNFSQREASPEQLDALFASRDGDPSRITFTATTDAPDQWMIGYFVLQDIDWEQGRIGNLGIRLHPDWCGKGIGTVLLSGAGKWCFAHGFTALTLDVAQTNTRAIRCYEKVGFSRIGEMVRDGNRFILMELGRDG
jgi:RimJ/RimL family protein N-acetyltransferase